MLEYLDAIREFIFLISMVLSRQRCGQNGIVVMPTKFSILNIRLFLRRPHTKALLIG